MRKWCHVELILWLMTSVAKDEHGLADYMSIAFTE